MSYEIEQFRFDDWPVVLEEGWEPLGIEVEDGRIYVYAARVRTAEVIPFERRRERRGS